MEKTFEEKFGLKTEEMEEILGGVVEFAVDAANSCSFCAPGCLWCTTCIGCTGDCYSCTTIVFF